MKCVALSDTHGLHKKIDVPDADILFFSGDMCNSGRLEEVWDFGDTLRQLPHKHKVVIAGNHDWPFERDNQAAREALHDLIYLQDDHVIIDGLKIYGSPWQPEFGRWAFNLKRGKELAEKWAQIPNDIDILLTHGPPFAILDTTYDRRMVGCRELRERLLCLTQLKAHIFGHIHEAYGRVEIDRCQFFNASICDLRLRASNSSWLFEV